MATYQFGSLSTLDTLGANFQFIVDFGEDRLYDDVENLFAAYNRISDELLNSFVDRTTEKMEVYGSAVTMKMEELDEHGVPHAQKMRVGSNVGFPLKRYGSALQWNRYYMLNARVADMAAQIRAIFTADLSNLVVQVKTALFSATNYTTNDPLVNYLGNTGLGSSVYIPVKALVNADGQEIPVGPNGESFDGTTHTHYLFSATLTAASQNALLNTVIEHFPDGSPMIYINRQEEATYRTLAGFVPYNDVRIVQPTTAASAPGVPLNVVNIYNRAIGVFSGAEVWVKPWVPPYYQFCFLEGQPRPLRLRERKAGSGVLVLDAEQESYPLRAKFYQREFGIGVWNRVNGAVNFSNSGSAYTAPTITAVNG